MNPITDLIFSVTWFILLILGVRSIVRGWSVIKNDTYKPKGMWTTNVTRPIHPEMKDVKPGEQLMGVTFEAPTCDLEEYKALQKRIEKLKSELEDPWEDDDDDDDGDIVVRT